MELYNAETWQNLTAHVIQRSSFCRLKKQIRTEVQEVKCVAQGHTTNIWHMLKFLFFLIHKYFLSFHYIQGTVLSTGQLKYE